MIELIVEDYCQECPEFTPDINQTIGRSWDDKTPNNLKCIVATKSGEVVHL